MDSGRRRTKRTRRVRRRARVEKKKEKIEESLKESHLKRGAMPESQEFKEIIKNL